MVCLITLWNEEHKIKITGILFSSLEIVVRMDIKKASISELLRTPLNHKYKNLMLGLGFKSSSTTKDTTNQQV